MVEQVCSRTSQVYNLGATIAILLQSRAFEAVERITDSLPTADGTLVLVVAEGALIADTDEGGWAHVGVTDGAFAVAFVTQAADGDSGLLAAHDEIGVVARHGDFGCKMYSVDGERRKNEDMLGLGGADRIERA